MFFSNAAREIAKDAQDVEGDAVMKARSIPLRWGLTRTKISVFLHVLAVLASEVVLGITLGFGPVVLPFAIGIIAMSVVIMGITLQRTSLEGFAHVSEALKWLMLIGLFQLFILPLDMS